MRIDPSKRNVIEVVSYNKAGLLSSLPLRFEVDRYVTTEPRPKMHILSIGVSKYAVKEWQLQYAVSDAETFARALSEAAKPIYDEVTVRTLIDAQVTARHINHAFEDLKSKVGPADVFVLFVAGHGRSPTGTYYFLPQNLSFADGRTLRDAIGQDQWQTWLAKIPAQKSILVFDTCESSTAAGLSRGGRERETAMDRLRLASGRSVITAARQAAFEGYKGHGVLTYAILDSLAKRENSGDELDLIQLAAHVYQKVPEFSEELTGEAQFPHTKIEGNFPIGLRGIAHAAAVPDAAISTTPTHVLIRLERIREKPRGEKSGEPMLSPGVQVRVIETDGDWVLVACEGKRMGYVPADALLRLQ